MKPIILTNDNFEEVALKSDVPVMIDFYADWCGPCKMAAPIVDELAGERTDVKICKVNVDDAPEIAAAFGVQSIPTFAVLFDGKAVDMAVGLRTKDQLTAMLDKVKE